MRRERNRLAECKARVIIRIIIIQRSVARRRFCNQWLSLVCHVHLLKSRLSRPEFYVKSDAPVSLCGQHTLAVVPRTCRTYQAPLFLSLFLLFLPFLLHLLLQRPQRRFEPSSIFRCDRSRRYRDLTTPPKGGEKKTIIKEIDGIFFSLSLFFFYFP